MASLQEKATAFIQENPIHMRKWVKECFPTKVHRTYEATRAAMVGSLQKRAETDEDSPPPVFGELSTITAAHRLIMQMPEHRTNDAMQVITWILEDRYKQARAPYAKHPPERPLTPEEREIADVALAILGTHWGMREQTASLLAIRDGDPSLGGIFPSSLKIKRPAPVPAPDNADKQADHPSRMV